MCVYFAQGHCLRGVVEGEVWYSRQGKRIRNNLNAEEKTNI